MIINVTREYGNDLWEVWPTQDNGQRIEVDGNDVPWRSMHCGSSVVWDRVGEVVASASYYFPEEAVTLFYRDHNSMAERARRRELDAPS
jgi:hypothetical protein